jgi:hypothetical protein
MLKFLPLFVVFSLSAYAVLSFVFWLNCYFGGHNPIEMLYGSVATYVLAFATGIEFALTARSWSRDRRP